MRARIVFNLKNRGEHLPFHHQSLVADWLYSPKFGPNFPELNYSGLKGQTKITPNGLSYLSTKVTLIVSSQDNELLVEYLQNVWNNGGVFSLGELWLELDSIYTENPPEFKQEMKYVTLSPIGLIEGVLFSEESKRMIHPESDEFSDILYESVMIAMENSGQYSPKDFEQYTKFQIVPDSNYLDKIKDGIKKYSRVYQIPTLDAGTLEFRGYTIPFSLHAHPDVHNFIFSNGIGAHTKQGYGMIDFAGIPFNERLQVLFSKESSYASGYEGRHNNASASGRSFKPRERVV